MTRRLIFFLFGICPLLCKAAPVRQAYPVKIGGIQQWIDIRGENDRDPVLLFLHGGPGNSVISYAHKFTDELQKKFVVVQWDQRESGRTKDLNHTDKPLTVALMVSDAVELINYLRTRFSKEKIYLMGHSWGGFLALEVAAIHPELLLACIPTAPMINQLESERKSLNEMLENARKQNNAEAIRELGQVHIPFESGDELYFHRRWLQLAAKKNPFSHSFVNKWAKTWLPLFNEASGINLFQAAPEIKCPVFFFVGKSDKQANSEITEQYFQTLKAEKKDLFWFTNSGHNLNLTEPEKYQDLVISLRLPEN